MICCWSHTFRNQCFYTGMLGVRLYSSSILLLGEYMDSLVKTELLIVQQSVLHVHNVFWKKWAPLAEFVMYQISWVQTHRLLPIALSLLLESLVCYICHTLIALCLLGNILKRGVSPWCWYCLSFAQDILDVLRTFYGFVLGVRSRNLVSPWKCSSLPWLLCHHFVLCS